MYGHDLDFTTACSDGRVVALKDDDGQLSVDYEARLQYCQCVRKARMLEFIDQVYTLRYFCHLNESVMVISLASE